MKKQKDGFWKIYKELMSHGDFLFYLIAPISIFVSLVFASMLYFGGVTEE